MSGRIEFAVGPRRNVDAYVSLAKQAGRTLTELADDIEVGGVAATTRRYAEKAAARNRRNRGGLTPRQVQAELLRRVSP